jgi:hypothetical protein
MNRVSDQPVALLIVKATRNPIREHRPALLFFAAQDQRLFCRSWQTTWTTGAFAVIGIAQQSGGCISPRAEE